ncbi:arrestin (or S-antigen) [Purpureocillium lavendulum]|uniref:Arrestin (Or S-antigen) n=1 Tax=Purpureocillium lavendulum TaxID=1247861 RepID=A0AB34FU41_9HYPO|nr:arrestin (or S-antigen) [Purpureocillium lavendulum]
MSLLVIWSSVQARIHTSPQGAALQPPPYNSSQSAVCGVWLFANIWLANFLRARIPSLNLPVVIYSILVNTSATTGATIPTTNIAESFVRELLVAMLFGLGLAAGVSLLIFPIGGRTVVFSELKTLTTLLGRTISLQRECLGHLAATGTFLTETPDTVNGTTPPKLGARLLRRATAGRRKVSRASPEEAKPMQLRQNLRAIRLLASKVWGDKPIAERSMAWGHLSSGDIHEAFRLYGNVTVSIVAMSTVMDVFRRAADSRTQRLDESPSMGGAADLDEQRRSWKPIVKAIHESLDGLAEPIVEGLEHAGICLGILPRPRRYGKPGGSTLVDTDVETGVGHGKPGEEKYGKLVIKKLKQHASTTVRPTPGGYQDPDTRRSPPANEDLDYSKGDGTTSGSRPRNQLQLDLLLYTEHLVQSIGAAVQDLVEFADRKVDDGTMSHRRFTFPTKTRLWKWVRGIFKKRGSSLKESPDVLEAGYISYGGDFKAKKDPERLPATSVWQRGGNLLCRFSASLGSKESAFGFRVACATMTVGILAFLEATQTFFQQQRLYWAMITIALGMTITSGQSVFGFFCRVGGTCLAMVLSLVNWYMVGQKTAGVIVFLWFFIFLEYYFIKFPRLASVVMITVITHILIIGYELQVRELGEAVATATGQPYYPTDLLGPYRLAVVAGGSLVAFFWTIFPSPLTDRTYFSIIVATLKAQLDDTIGDVENKSSPAYKMLKARRKAFGYAMRLLSSMESHIEWQRWEPRIGGRFPVKQYQDIFLRVKRIMGYMTLMSYAIPHPSQEEMAAGSDEKASNMGRKGGPSLQAISDAAHGRVTTTADHILQGIDVTHHTVISALTLMSNSMLSGQSLPPFLPLPQEYGIAQNSAQSQPNLAEAVSDSAKEPLLHVWDPQVEDSDSGASAPHDAQSLEESGNFMIRLCSMLVCDDLEGLMRTVSDLVGVVDFDVRYEGGDGGSGGTNGSGSRQTRH